MSGPKQETKAERRAREDAEADAKQTPFGFFILGQSYLQSANVLVAALEDPALGFDPQYKHPIRHLYAHGWELCLKACLLEQGTKPSQLKMLVGHSLTTAWEAIDRPRFAAIQLAEDLQPILVAMELYHPSKLHAYPVSGWQQMPTFRYLREISERLLLPGSEVSKMFSGSRAHPNAAEA